MRLELRAERSDALPLLPAVASHRICRIEGYNGIGKTLSIRVLEVCTGRQPYRGHRLAWNALRQGLGPVSVRISDLVAGAGTIEWRFDTRRWGAVEEDINEDWFDVDIDGASATLADVRRLLSVHRIAGNEGLVGTLSQQIRTDAELVRHWQQRYVGRDNAALQQVSALVGRARQLLTRVDDGVYFELQEHAQAASTAATAVRTELENAERRLEYLELAAAVSGRLNELADAGGNLERDLTALDASLADAARRVEKIRERLDTVERRVARSEPVRDQLAAARKLRTTRLGRLEGAVKELSRLLQVAQVDEVEEADQRLVEVRAELARLVIRRAAVDAGPRMRVVLKEMDRLLGEAEREGLGTQELLAASGVTFSVSEAREAFASRAAALAGTDESGAGAALSHRIANESERLRALGSLDEQGRKVHRARELLAAADDQIRDLIETADETSGEEAEQLRPALREAEERVRQTATARASMRRRQQVLTGMGSLEDLQRERDELLAEGDSTPQEVEAEVSVIRGTLAALRLRKEESELLERAAAARVAGQERLITDATAALGFADEYQWIRYVDPEGLPRPDDSVERQLELLGVLRRRIDSVAGRVGDLGTQVGGVWKSLDDLADQVRSGQAAVDGRSYLPALRHSLGEQYSGYFNEPEVRNALLPMASRATISLESMAVEWEGPAGGGSRPLEAFSSGQQAFAYTRAMLAGLNLQPGTRAANRLIALDEFGAFVARDRVEDLIAMLRAHRDRHAADQVLVILPVSEDYPGQLAGDPPERLRPRLERIVHELKERSYFTEEFAL